MHNAPFEIITVKGIRIRCDTPGYRWQYALKQGTIDKEDKAIVEILRGEELTQAVSQVILAGNVTEDSLLIMPSEIRSTLCPQCGFSETPLKAVD